MFLERLIKEMLKKELNPRQKKILEALKSGKNFAIYRTPHRESAWDIHLKCKAVMDDMIEENKASKETT
jgi:hypothetical protein